MSKNFWYSKCSWITRNCGNFGTPFFVLILIETSRRSVWPPFVIAKNILSPLPLVLFSKHSVSSLPPHVHFTVTITCARSKTKGVFHQSWICHHTQSPTPGPSMNILPQYRSAIAKLARNFLSIFRSFARHLFVKLEILDFDYDKIYLKKVTKSCFFRIFFADR